MAKKPVPDVKPEMTDSAKKRLIASADLGPIGTPYQAVLKIRKFKSEMPGTAVYKVAQLLIGLAIVFAFRALFGVPSNTLSNALTIGFLIGAVLGGAARFAAWSAIWWGIAGIVCWLALDMPIASPSWWRSFHDAWANQGMKVPQWQLGALIAASLFWIAVGRVACRGMGVGMLRLVERATIKMSQKAEDRRVAEEAAEFDRTRVSAQEVDRVVVRSENDARRQVVFGGQKIVKGGIPAAGGVDLGKAETVEPMAAVDVAREYGSLAGTVSALDQDLISGAIGDDDDDDGFVPSSSYGSSDASEFSSPSPSPVSAAVAVIDAAAVPAVSVVAPEMPRPATPQVRPTPNPTASENSRRLMRENLGSMIGVFKIHTAHDQVEQFYKNSRVRLLRLTDEDYEELEHMDYGGEIIALSRRAKNESLTVNRDAVAVATDTDVFLAGGAAPEPVAATPVPAPTILVPDEDDGEAFEHPATDVADQEEEDDDTVVFDAPLIRDIAPGARSERFAAMLAENLPEHRPSVSAADLLATTSRALAPAPAPVEAPVDSHVAADDVRLTDETPEQHNIEAMSPEGTMVSFIVDDAAGEETDTAANDAAPSGSGDDEMELRDYPLETVVEAYKEMNATREDYQHREVMAQFEKRTGMGILDVLQSPTASGMLQPAMLDPVLRTVRRAMQLSVESPIDQLTAMHNERISIMEVEFKRAPHDFRRLQSRFNAIRGEMQKLALNNGIVPGATELMAADSQLTTEFDLRVQEKITGKPIARPTVEEQPSPFAGVAGEIMAMRGTAPATTGPRLPIVGDGEDEDHVSATQDARAQAEAAVAPAPAAAPEPATNAEEDVVVLRLKRGSPEARAHLQSLLDEEKERERAEQERKDEERRDEEKRQAEVARVEQERKDEEERRLLAEREEQEKRDREERSASFRNSIGARITPVIDAIPDRFDTPAVRSAVLFVIESSALLTQMRKDGSAARNAFSIAFAADNDRDPTSVDMMTMSIVRAENELAIQVGDRAREILSLVRDALGLPAKADMSQLRGLLQGNDETRFVDVLASQAEGADRAVALGDEYKGHLASSAAESVRATIAAEADGRVAAAVEDASAARAAAAEETAARAAAEDLARDLQAELNDMRKRLEEELSRPKTPADEARKWLQEVAKPVENRSSLDAFVFERPAGDVVIVVWVPDDVYTEQQIDVDGRKAKLEEVVDRAIVRKIQGDLPFGVDVVRLLLIANGSEDDFKHRIDLPQVIVLAPVKADIEAEINA